jgi:hypothetical protein
MEKRWEGYQRRNESNLQRDRSGKYKVVVTDINTGCSKTSAATTINITCKEEGFYAEVHPNPSNSVFEVQFNDEAQYEIRVFDILGQLIFSIMVPEKFLSVKNVRDLFA